METQQLLFVSISNHLHCKYFDCRVCNVFLVIFCNKNPKLTDISSNDPDGMKEIDIKLNENAYSLGLNYTSVMRQVRAAFFGIEAQRFQRGEDEIKVWIRYDQKSRSFIKSLEEIRITTPDKKRIPLNER